MNRTERRQKHDCMVKLHNDGKYYCVICDAPWELPQDNVSKNHPPKIERPTKRKRTGKPRRGK